MMAGLDEIRSMRTDDQIEPPPMWPTCETTGETAEIQSQDQHASVGQNHISVYQYMQHVCVCGFLCVCVSLSVCLCVCVNVYVNVRVFVCARARACVFIFMCMCVYVYIHMYIYIYIYIRTRTHTNTPVQLPFLTNLFISERLHRYRPQAIALAGTKLAKTCHSGSACRRTTLCMASFGSSAYNAQPAQCQIAIMWCIAS